MRSTRLWVWVGILAQLGISGALGVPARLQERHVSGHGLRLKFVINSSMSIWADPDIVWLTAEFPAA